MLASDQEAEAETARRKLLDHLAQHGVSISDLTARLRQAPSATLDAMSRETLQHAEYRAQRAETARTAAEGMNSRLLRIADQARRRLWTAWAVSAGLAGTLAMVGLVYLLADLGASDVKIARANTVQQVEPRVADSVRSRDEPAPPNTEAQPSGARTVGEWTGTVQLTAELLDEANSAAQRRAMLDPGARVLVLQTGPVWLHVRSEHGDGYVLKALVRPDRT